MGRWAGALAFALAGWACDGGSAAATADVAVAADGVAGTDAAAAADTEAGGQRADAVGAEAASVPGDAVADLAADPDGGALDQVEPADADPPKPYPAELKLGLTPWTMAPKEETTRCILKRLDNEVDVWVHQIHTKLAKGSHHLIVYRSDATIEQPEPKKCTPFTETLAGGNVPLMISQVAQETLSLPKGVAFKFAAKQMIRIEAHYLNYYKDPIETGADISFSTLPKDKVVHEADMLFYGTPDFSLKPGKSTTTPWNFIDVWAGTHVFATTGHTHQYGTDVQIALAQGGTQTDAPLVYPPKDKPFDWAEAPMAVYDPPLQFKAGQGFQYRCSWYNPTTKNIGFGESANQEMCFFWAYYYPSKGYRMCINPGQWKKQAPDLITDPVCCPDSPLCGLIKSYLSSGGFGGGG
ncbi:MAG: hypothetical protein FJ100_18750 [Deltaproteobacteria bacterium]|nr:hypothetical protein [Deltaproteobacteria bacterium]